MFGSNNKSNGSPAPSGAMMMLRSLGFDPEQILGGVEAAKAEALRVMQHFDARLSSLEQRASEQHVVLCKILLVLEEQKKHNLTQHDTTNGAVSRLGE